MDVEYYRQDLPDGTVIESPTHSAIAVKLNGRWGWHTSGRNRWVSASTPDQTFEGWIVQHDAKAVVE